MRRLLCTLLALTLLLSPFQTYAAGRARSAPIRHASPKHAAAKPRSTHARTPAPVSRKATSSPAIKTRRPAQRKSTVTKQSAIQHVKPTMPSRVPPANSRVPHAPPAVAHKKSNGTPTKMPVPKPPLASHPRTTPASPKSTVKKTPSAPRKNSPQSATYRDEGAMPIAPASASPPAVPNTDPNPDKKLTETSIAINIAGILSRLTAPADPRAPAWQWAPQPVEDLAEPGAPLGPYQRQWSVPVPPRHPTPPAPSPAPPAPAPPQPPSSNASNERAADMLTGTAIGLSIAQVLLMLL